jgi:hypothetical protein
VLDPSPLRRIYFGQVTLAPEVLLLRQRLDRALFGVCRSLPSPLVDDAMNLLAGYGLPAGSAPARGTVDSIDFFHLFYSPLWSWIHWSLDATNSEEIIAGQAMAMFLHLFDDHLQDGHLRCDPLRLQLRTAAWLRLEDAVRRLHDDRLDLKAAWNAEVERYFAAIHHPPAVTDLDGYCARFRDQMATCLGIPMLTHLRLGKKQNAAALRQILCGLGVAWRLLDDVQDAYADLFSGEQTSIYILLDEAGRMDWQRVREAGPESHEKWLRLVESCFRSGLFKGILSRCCAELEEAAQLSLQAGWEGLGVELRQLRHPVNDLVSRLR